MTSNNNPIGPARMVPTTHITTGTVSHIHGRNIVPELSGLVDEYSVSLDAPDSATYERLCAPSFDGAFDAVLDFIRSASKDTKVTATVVDVPGVDIDKCRELAEGLGAAFRVRRMDVVG